MNKIKRFRVSFIFTGIWLVCFAVIIIPQLISKIDGYATAPEGAKTLGGFWGECSGSVFHYAKGYRCDAYGPSGFALIIILVGFVAFLCTVFSFLFTLRTRSK